MMEFLRAPVERTSVAGTPLYIRRSTKTWQSASMCVWFDNDTFGALVSPTMTTAKLASTMDAVRPSLELYAK